MVADTVTRRAVKNHARRSPRGRREARARAPARRPRSDANAPPRPWDGPVSASLRPVVVPSAVPVEAGWPSVPAVVVPARVRAVASSDSAVGARSVARSAVPAPAPSGPADSAEGGGFPLPSAATQRGTRSAHNRALRSASSPTTTSEPAPFRPKARVLWVTVCAVTICPNPLDDCAASACPFLILN